MAKQFIVLYGLANSGKTTTLRHTIETLTGVRLKKNHENWRVVFDYEGKTIALSTFGDKPRDIKNDISFFEGKKPKVKIVQIAKGTCKDLTASDLSKMKFDICISACRVEDDMQNVQLLEAYLKSKGGGIDVQWLFKPKSSGWAASLIPNNEDIHTSLRIIYSINK